MRWPIAALAAAALSITPAAAQDARLAGRLDPPVLDQVTALLESNRAAGLPTEPLVDKALEGASKRASGDRILAAVRALAADLTAARDALGVRAAEPELVAGAAAIRAGAEPRDLARLRGQRGTALTVPLAVLANLMARGVPGDTASAVVYRLLASGAPDTEFTELQAAVERDIGTGASPGAAAAVRGGGQPDGNNPSASPSDGAPGRGGVAGGGRPENPGRSGAAGGGRPDNPGNSGAGRPSNPGRGNGPPQASPSNGGRGRGQPSPASNPRNPRSNNPNRPK